jgi:hypothetical protein
MMGKTGSIVGRSGGFTRRYPGGSGYVSIFWSVFQLMPNC